MHGPVSVREVAAVRFALVDVLDENSDRIIVV